ncbi:antitoxin [Bifidobacterium lemurum]|uniref:Antitoxin n=1 Tax=Bifidobacterium lemurum TaxID=1603886 RepID=A0A261FW86_9BIFI|nr:HepT-like ribonuclease domain-containing protein [Bifidobacterium lemurum]OZG63441.1 antitoxin [Bifidobacterium lemurum]
MDMRQHINQEYRDVTALIRLVEHLERAHQDASVVNSADELESDHMRFNSVAMDMMQVQESAKRLSQEFVDGHPDLPWSEMRALRNVIVHQYDEIDVYKLYESATDDAERLLEQLLPHAERLDG